MKDEVNPSVNAANSTATNCDRSENPLLSSGDTESASHQLPIPPSLRSAPDSPSSGRKRKLIVPLSKKKLPNRFKVLNGETLSLNSFVDGERNAVLTKEEHKSLVAAIFDIGMSESSPSSILEHMSTSIKKKYPALNVERLKSKLQKYRKSKEKNKTNFMGEYDSTFDEISAAIPLKKQKVATASNQDEENQRKGGGGEEEGDVPQPLHPSLVASLSSGDIAAYLSHSIMLEDENPNKSQQPLTTLSQSPLPTTLPQVRQAIIPCMSGTGSTSKGGDNKAFELPKLSQAELNSPLGHAFQNFVGLFNVITHNLEQQRTASSSITSVSKNSTVPMAPSAAYSLPQTTGNQYIALNKTDDEDINK